MDREIEAYGFEHQPLDGEELPPIVRFTLMVFVRFFCCAVWLAIQMAHLSIDIRHAGDVHQVRITHCVSYI